MILTAHQPSYLPWIGLFHKIYLAEQFCLYDDVQFTKKDFVSRNYIKTVNGPILLSVPVVSKNHREKLLNNVEILDNGWSVKHIKSIQLSYSKAPYFSKYFNEIADLIVNHRAGTLAKLNQSLTVYFLDLLGIHRDIHLASNLNLIGNKSDRIIDMCQKLEADRYVFGRLGQAYADFETFRSTGIKPFFQDYQHPTYPQIHGGFVPNLSIIDLLFNMGPDSLEVILSGNIKNISELE
jgi:hypothetical protein